MLFPSRLMSAKYRRRWRNGIIASVVAAILITATIVTLVVVQPGPPPNRTQSRAGDLGPVLAEGPRLAVTAKFNRQRSIDDPNSFWVVINKQRPVNPTEFEPPLVEVNVPGRTAYLRLEAADAVVAMFAAISAETGLEMQSTSAYRSYSTQASVYSGWVSSLGQTAADLTSARAGFSEHQIGLAIDVDSRPGSGCAAEQCWGNTPQAAWVAENAWRFGFIVRYPQGKTDVTGYEWEPWHLRYVGPELATRMRDTGFTTMEEFFGLPAAPTY